MEARPETERRYASYTPQVPAMYLLRVRIRVRVRARARVRVRVRVRVSKRTLRRGPAPSETCPGVRWTPWPPPA